ncbi:MAG: hypothetical protein AMK71_07725 [Nitrospira bacterium SG8_35_4]|nr:MAG: hypothetical protein AMK71_07725 [Nitrospira bacterium SG8_35_4]
MQSISSAIFIMIGFILIQSGVASSEQSTHPDWYVYAKQYIRFDNELPKLFTRESVTMEEFKELNNHRDEAEKNFLNSLPPSKKEIGTLLSSSNIEDITIGTVSIYLLEKYHLDFIDTLINLLTSSDDKSTQRFILLSFEKIPPDVLASYESVLLDYISKTDEGWMLFHKSEVLLKLTPEKSAVILSDWLGRDSRLFKRVAYIYLGNLGTKYQENALDNLVKTRNIDKEKFLDELYGGRERRPRANSINKNNR